MVPTLIVWGTRDVFFALKWAQRLSELIPGTTKVATLDGARMHFPDERAAEFLPLVCAMASAKRSNAEKEKPMSDPARLPGLAGPGNLVNVWLERITHKTRVIFEGDYLREHINLGYASTVHSAQGGPRLIWTNPGLSKRGTVYPFSVGVSGHVANNIAARGRFGRICCPTTYSTSTTACNSDLW
jgi:hypothetical protein